MGEAAHGIFGTDAHAADGVDDVRSDWWGNGGHGPGFQGPAHVGSAMLRQYRQSVVLTIDDLGRL